VRLVHGENMRRRWISSHFQTAPWGTAFLRWAKTFWIKKLQRLKLIPSLHFSWNQQCEQLITCVCLVQRKVILWRKNFCSLNRWPLLHEEEEEDMFRTMQNFFVDSGLQWTKLFDTDGAPLMMRSNSGCKAHINQVASHTIFTHRVLHRYNCEDTVSRFQGSVTNSRVF
jgi:hypothetical protein